MKIYYTDHFELPLPPGHRFPMSKYRLLRNAIVEDVYHADDVLIVPTAATFEQLCVAHDPGYVLRVIEGTLTEAEIKRIGFPWSEKMVERSRRSSGATLAAARSAMHDGASVNLAGGTHHALRSAGEGFCIFNDAAVTILNLKSEAVIESAIVIDCDVHQGNGTADILRSVDYAFTFSIHGKKNFPLRKVASDMDVDLPDGAGDDDYLTALQEALESIFVDRSFDLAIYLAGADPYEGDRLGRLKLTKSGLERRDRLVLSYLAERCIPVAIAMAGGYATQVSDIVDIHRTTVRAAKEIAFRTGKSNLQ